jgi:uroporphyrinogen-III synthase
MRALDGRAVGVLESRRGAELAALVRQLGGIVVSAPAVQQIERPDDIGRFTDLLVTGCFDIVIFLTGAGVNAVLDDADRRQRLNATVATLGQITLACRGPKPLAALRRHGLTPAVTTVKPHTSCELADALAPVDLEGRSVGLIHYGERQPMLTETLRGRGADVHDVCAYEWMLPDDLDGLIALVDDVIAKRLDALLVTSQIQYRHLFEVADRLHRVAALHNALRDDVVLGAIGPVCADVIRRSGIVPDVMPPTPNLPSLVRALADYFDLVRGEAGRVGL